MTQRMNDRRAGRESVNFYGTFSRCVVRDFKFHDAREASSLFRRRSEAL